MELNAIISIAPEKELLDETNTFDQERVKIGTRSKLYGIPIIVKALNCENLTPSMFN